MRIDLAGGGKVFVVSCTYEEREIPRCAGFKFHPTNRRWYTTDPLVVGRMPAWCLSEDVKKALGFLVSTIPHPEDREYLPFQEEGIRFALQRRATLIADQPGLGKGHPATTPVLTPTGWRPIGDLVIGDAVVGAAGLPVLVSGVFHRGLLPVYRVVFSDGASILCDGDHLWAVTDIDGVEEVIETYRLQNRVAAAMGYSIPLIDQGPAFPAKLFAVEPSIAGVDTGSMWCFKVGKRYVHAYTDLPSYDVRDYAMGSRAQRLAFLKGLVGHVGRVQKDTGDLYVDFVRSEASKPIIDAVREIVLSVGGLTETIPVYYKNPRVRLKIYLNAEAALPVFGYQRENVRMGPRWRHYDKTIPRRWINSITPAGTDDVVCIMVDAPDHLYVAEHYIVTHNTVQGIGLVNALGPERARNGIILAPASLKRNWLKEWSRWTTRSDLSIDIADKTLPSSDFVILNPEQLPKFANELRAQTWDTLIADEAHYYANRDAGRTKHLFGGNFESRYTDERGKVRKKKFSLPPVPARRKLFLSGTPITKAPVNLWTMVRECDPNGWGRDFTLYAYQFCGAYTDAFGNLITDGESNLDQLREYLHSTFMIRRLKMDVLKDLPEKVRQIVPLPADGLRRKMKAEQDAVTSLLDAYEQMMGVQVTGPVEDIIEKILSIQPKTWEAYAAVCDGKMGMADLPLNRLATARQDLALAKVDLVAEYVKNLVDQGEDVVVFAYHQLVIEALSEKFPDFGVIYGKTPMGKRQGIVDEFQENPHRRGIIGQLTAAGTGYTMTKAHHVVFAELTWVPHELHQAEDRIHRIGQLDTCWEHYLVVQGSLDDSMIDKLHYRIRVIEEALDRHA